MAEKERKKHSKLGRVITAVIIAIAAWGVVAYTTDSDIEKRINGVAVEITGGETLRAKGFVTVNDNELPKVSVKIRGKRGDLIKYIDGVKVMVDVSNIKNVGDYNLETLVKLPSSRLTVEHISLNYVPIKVEKYESKEIPIKTVVFGNLNKKVVDAVAETETVTVYGAKSELEYAEYASVELNADDIKDGETVLPYSVVCSDNAPENVHIYNSGDGTVKITSTVYDAYEVPIKVECSAVSNGVLNAEATESFPKKITVGVKDGKAPEYVTIYVESLAGEGEYEVADQQGVYIPQEFRKVKVKPVWEPQDN